MLELAVCALIAAHWLIAKQHRPSKASLMGNVCSCICRCVEISRLCQDGTRYCSSLPGKQPSCIDI